MKEIVLTQGKTAIVDDGDFEWLSQWKWYAYYNKFRDRWEPRRNYGRRPNRTTIRMYRAIMDCVSGDGKIVDHINHNALDNRRSNLRIATHSQNIAHQKGAQKGNACGLLGINWREKSQRFVARIQKDKKIFYLGSFPTAEEAVIARDMAAKMHHKEFATLNTIEKQDETISL